MSDGGKYWDVPWNPVRGCCPVSAGCAHCWAAAQASRFAVPAWKGLAEGGKWTGETRFDAETLANPLRWRKPRVVATCWMGDLFHKNVADEQIAAVFGVMAACPQHRFLVLTKRAERMRRWWFKWSEGRPVSSMDLPEIPHPAKVALNGALYMNWPLPNVWLGVSVEDQATADERIAHLLASPAAVRWVSYEPALGAADFTNIGATTSEGMWRLDALRGALHREGRNEPTMGSRLDWIVVGGESAQGGKDARSCDVEWIRDVVRQCKAAGVLAYVKQIHDERGRLVTDPKDFPVDLRIRELPWTSGRG